MVLNELDPIIAKKDGMKVGLVPAMANEDAPRILMPFRIMPDFDIVTSAMICRGICFSKTAWPMYIREALQRCFARLRIGVIQKLRGGSCKIRYKQ